MNILDIDLDFFLSVIPTIAAQDRLDSTEYFAWSDEKVRLFLENQCGLSPKKPIQGSVFTHHHEAFIFWRDLIQKNILTTPFEVVHVDAHADLGLSLCDGSWKYISGELLSLPLEQRITSCEGGKNGLSANNYLYFALACHWIKKLTYVHHPKMNNDLPPLIFKDFNTESGLIQLKKYDKKVLENERFFDSLQEYPILETEDEIPFALIKCNNYKANSVFDFVFLTQSPSYTPIASDKLIPIIKDYIDLGSTGSA